MTGVLRDMGSLLKADVYGMVMNEDGFREIADENAIDGTTFRIQFKPGVNNQEAINKNRSCIIGALRFRIAQALVRNRTVGTAAE